MKTPSSGKDLSSNGQYIEIPYYWADEYRIDYKLIKAHILSNDDVH